MSEQSPEKSSPTLARLASSPVSSAQVQLGPELSAALRQVKRDQKLKLPSPQHMPEVLDSDGEKPPYMNIQLAAMAIVRGSGNRRSMNQIYDWVAATFLFYRELPKSQWRKALSNAIQNHKNFVREVGKDEIAGEYFWKVRPGLEYDSCYYDLQSFLEPHAERANIIAALPEQVRVAAQTFIAAKGWDATNGDLEVIADESEAVTSELDAVDDQDQAPKLSTQPEERERLPTSSAPTKHVLRSTTSEDLKLPIGLSYQLKCHMEFAYGPVYKELRSNMCGQTAVTDEHDTLDDFMMGAMQHAWATKQGGSSMSGLRASEIYNYMRCKVFVSGDPDASSLASSDVAGWSEITDTTSIQGHLQLQKWFMQRANEYGCMLKDGRMTVNDAKDSIRSDIEIHVYFSAVSELCPADLGAE